MVLLSQRRRWINSTIHNLMELLFVHDLCGTFCFSMQFVIFMELVGTLALPAAISFTVYLIVMAILGKPAIIPLILLALILGLPAVLIVMTSRKIVYVGWMLVYLISLPIWNFVLPTYAYWHFDDFSWGDTRKVEGAVSDKKGGHADKSGEFDSSVITMKKWSEYERERRIKEALERNLPMPRFLDRPGSTMDVFRDSEFVVKRYSKTGSAGSNDSDVPLTQMGYVPTINNRTYQQDPHTRQNHTTDVGSSSSSAEAVGPDIPLHVLPIASSSSLARPRGNYNAGLTTSGINYDHVNEEEDSDPYYRNQGGSMWSDPAPHHRVPLHDGFEHDGFDDDTRSPYNKNIPMPPSHDKLNNSK